MDGADFDSVVIETARKHPLTVALWLVLDAVQNTAITAQDAIEARMRAEVDPDHRPGIAEGTV